jgi:hypothetical protein
MGVCMCLSGYVGLWLGVCVFVSVCVCEFVRENVCRCVRIWIGVSMSVYFFLCATYIENVEFNAWQKKI